jgi:dTMP kinase
MPDITILLDIDPFIALSRLEGKAKHRLEGESAEYHLKLRQGYLERARKYPNRIRVFEANHPVESVFKSIWVELYSFFQIRGVIHDE